MDIILSALGKKRHIIANVIIHLTFDLQPFHQTTDSVNSQALNMRLLQHSMGEVKFMLTQITFSNKLKGWVLPQSLTFNLPHY